MAANTSQQATPPAHLKQRAPESFTCLSSWSTAALASKPVFVTTCSELLSAQHGVPPLLLAQSPCTPLQAELSNETNLFFHYTSCLTPELFEGVQQRQGLMVDFAAFPSVLITCLDDCVRQPHTHFCYLELHPDGEADLSFIQASCTCGCA